MKRPTDKQRFKFIQNHGMSLIYVGYGRWHCRSWHPTDTHEGNTPRKAIDAAMRAEKKGNR